MSNITVTFDPEEAEAVASALNSVYHIVPDRKPKDVAFKARIESALATVKEAIEKS